MSNVFINQSKIEISFTAFLRSIGVSEKTQINYLSDIRHFFEFLFSQFQLTQPTTDLMQTLVSTNTETLEAYKDLQLTNNTPPSTINRRLSSIRMFFRFLQESGALPSNPSLDIKNITQITDKQVLTQEAILGKFEQALKQEGAADVTIRNYLTDVEQFLLWVQKSP